MVTENPTDSLAARYDTMWSQAMPALRAGGAVDSWLSRRAEDPRRGLSLVARPTAETAAALAAFLESLRTLEPEQYYQPASDLHVTVLSLFTATADYEPYLVRLADYQSAIEPILENTPPFEIDVHGVTSSNGAVLAQGFPRGDGLTALRDGLRQALMQRGVGESLDGRYRIVTAHLTLVRFAAPLRDPDGFVALLTSAREREFGAWRVENLELVFGDWYHAATHERRLARYPLAGKTRR